MSRYKEDNAFKGMTTCSMLASSKMTSRIEHAQVECAVNFSGVTGENSSHLFGYIRY